MLNETDKYLVRAIQNGDYRAFEMMFNGYYRKLCKYANGIVNSQETAEDLVSDLFVKIWEQPHDLEITISLEGYLFRSIRNSSINFITRKRKKFHNLDDETMEKLHEIMMPLKEEASMGVIVTELNEEIKKTIDLLPSECNKIFLMSRQDGLSHREIADKLSISENTVKVQIYRALIKLKEALKEYL